ncbi:MAG: KEOPS complex subunit Pcc1 [Candidatus Altiarchaeota archaeon]
MMCKAILIAESLGAVAVAKALNGDNVRMDSLTVRTSSSTGKVTTEIDCESVSTLMATVDDLLRCQMTSESLI